MHVPKSASFMWPFLSSNMLSGLTSLGGGVEGLNEYMTPKVQAHTLPIY